MGSLTKLPSTGLGTGGVGSSNINDGDVTENKIGSNAVTSGKISDGTVSANDLASTLDLSSKSITLPTSSFNTQSNNIALLGFKMAVNESLTVFNLVDGVVDEFNDETGTDESEGSNDLYNATDDYYINSTQPDGTPMASYTAGFSIVGVTEPDTSSAATNPTQGTTTSGSFTVPTDITQITGYVIGGGGGAFDRAANGIPSATAGGGGGGITYGAFDVTPGQTLYIGIGEAGLSEAPAGAGGGGGGGRGAGGGLSYVGTAQIPLSAPNQPQVFLVGAGGGGSGEDRRSGGGGGGLTGGTGGQATGGTQIAGGTSLYGQAGSAFQGGNAGGNSGAGGGGFFGGGGAGPDPGTNDDDGGGGSSYFGHPQVTGGGTEGGGPGSGAPSGNAGHRPGTPGPYTPLYGAGLPTGAGDGGVAPPIQPGEGRASDGYVLLQGSVNASVTSSTIVSATFTATSEPSTARIVVFEENVDTPTLNTDIIASVSRDGTNFSNATLSDSGYVTGSSGQRILTGTVDISGQPTGTSMRWKLALANNQIKIHGVSLSWA